jgi:hypothetical protein
MIRVPLFLLSLFLAGCATTDKGRAQLVVPDEVGAIYSEVDLRTRLVLAADTECSGDDCEAAAAFRRQVGEAGARLTKAAYAAYPKLERRIPRFEFSVPDKNEIGTLSNAKGSIVIFSGLSELGMDEAALNFVIAREMGHVIGRHHQENSALSILVSVAAYVLFPMTGIIQGVAAVVPVAGSATAAAGSAGAASTSFSALGTATSSAVTMVSSRVLQAVYRSDQIEEADAIAFKLLKQAGWNLEEVAKSVEIVAPKLARIGEGGWISEFNVSKMQLDLLDCSAPWTSQPEIVLTTLNNIHILPVYDSPQR